MDKYSQMYRIAKDEMDEENKPSAKPLEQVTQPRDVYVADLDLTVNTDLNTPDEINYATMTQVLSKPKEEYMGLKETENPFKLAYNASVDSLKNVLDKVSNTVAPTGARKIFEYPIKGAVVAGANAGNLTWGATKILATEMAMNREMSADKNKLEQSYMKREISQEEYFQQLKDLTARKTEEQNQMREFIAKDIQANNEAFNKWLQDCGFTPDTKIGKFFYDLGGSITSIGMSVLAFALTKNPMLAISLISVPEFTSTYTQAIEKGKGPETAMSAGLSNYAFTVSSEYLGGKVLWSTLSKSGAINKAVKKITNLNPRLAIPFASGIEEGTQESSQTFGSEYINRFYDISQIRGVELVKEALYNGLQAFLGAFLFGAGASNIQFYKIFNEEKSRLLKLKDSDGKQIYTPEQATQIAKNTANTVQSRQLQEEILNISRAERDNSLSKEARNPKEMKKLIEENLKKMETALPVIKKELMDIKEKTKASVLKLGVDEEQATMVAEITQARAMLMYNAFGITPLQFYYLNELEITVDENSNILSNGRKTGYTVKFDEEKATKAIASGDISNIIKSIRTKENLDKFGNFVNKLVNEGRLTKEQRSLIYAQLADRTEEIPTVAQVVDRVREEEVDKFNQPAWHGSPRDFDIFDLTFSLTGEGAMAHGWGLYFAKNKETSERYRKNLIYKDVEILYDGKAVDKETDEMFRDYVIKKKEDGRITLNSWAKNLKQKIKNSIEAYENDIKFYKGIVDKLRQNKDKKIEDISFTEKEKEEVNNVIDGIEQDAIFNDQTEEFEKDKQSAEFVSHIADSIENVEIKNWKDTFLKEEQDKLNKLNSIDLSKIEIKPAGQVFKVEIPENDVLLDEQLKFQLQPKKVKKSLVELFKSEDFKERLLGFIENIVPSTTEKYKTLKSFFEAKIKGNEKEATSLYKHYMFDLDYIESEEEEIFEIINDVAQMVNEGEGFSGRRIYNILTTVDINGKKGASLLLNQYGIKGISYDGQMDGRAYVIFDDKAVKVLEKFYQMGGPKAKTALLNKLEIAKELEQNNVDEKAIWKQTGWLHDIDGKWKFEIDDSKAKLKEKNLTKDRTTLSDILSHKDLYEAYPELKDIPVFIETIRGGRGTTYGYIISEDFAPKIFINKSLLRKKNFDRIKSTLIHEIQHYIQSKEDFAVGGNTKRRSAIRLPRYLKDTMFRRDALSALLYSKLQELNLEGLSKDKNVVPNIYHIKEYEKDLEKLAKKDKDVAKQLKEWKKLNETLYEYDNNTNYARYRRMKGEVEARNSQARIDMTNEQRNKSLPYETQDVENDNIIIKFKDGTEVSYRPKQNGFTGKNLPAVRGELLPRDINTPVTEQTKSIIRVFQSGDKSTIIHEMAHIFLRDIEVIENQGGVQDEQFKKIKKTLDNWLGKKEGQKYTTEQQEKFAEGFETYMATGQAPKEELKGVFDYFKKWMSDIYGSIKNMIPITPEVKNMFDEILTLQPANNAIQTQTEGGNGGNGNIINTPQTQEGGDIVPVTPDAKDLGKIENKKGFIKSATDVILDTIEPISTRLGGIDTRLDYEMKMFEARLSIRQKKYKDASIEFLQETDKLKAKNNQDYLNYDRALKNSDINTINRINEKYPELKKAYEKVRQMLDSIKADLEIYGVSSSVQNYFPRKIANIDGLISYLEGNQEWSDIERAMKKKDPNYKKWSEEQKAEFVASYLSGYQKGVTNSSSHTKQRKIMTITDEIDRYYENSNNALLEYIEDISNFLEVAKLLRVGKDKAYEMVSISKDGTINLEEVIRNIESVLGTFVKDLVKNKEITREQEKKIADLLRARFNFKNTNNAVSAVKSVGYLATLGNINAVITQFGDLSYSIDNAGIFGTLKAIFGKKKIKMQDIGIDHPAEDFKDGVSFSQKLVDKVLTAIGFTKIDELGKNTFIATTFMKYKKAIEKNEQKVYEDISRRYGEEFAKDLIKDLKSDTLSDNIYLFAHTELARVQPISLSEMPKEYLIHPVGRIFYSLKTFWIKQFNRIVTDNKRLIQEGIKEKNSEKIKEGATSMARLIILFMILGSATDMLKDLIYLRKIDMEDTVFDNFLKILGISRYTMYKGREEGYGRVILDSVFNVPVMQMIDSFVTELGRASNGKMKLKDLRIASNIPIIGNPYYWWVGGGRTKEKKKNKRRVL